MIVSGSLHHTAPPERPTCIALGMFEGLHRGHMAVIEQAISCARRFSLSPGVFTFTIGALRPASKEEATQLLTEPMRERILSRLGVERILRPPFDEFRGLSPEDFVSHVLREKLRARQVVCGQNFRFGNGAAADAGDLVRIGAALGIETAVVPMVEVEGDRVSSSLIRERVRQGDIPRANLLLGRRFSIDFEVVAGRRLGRTLRFPTINQPFPAGFTVPRYGVYATLALVDGQWRPSVTNVGIKPTVGSDTELAETFIHGYDVDLYGRRVEVAFLQFLRPERKFGSIEELRAQIELDSARSLSVGRAALHKAPPCTRRGPAPDPA